MTHLAIGDCSSIRVVLLVEVVEAFEQTLRQLTNTLVVEFVPVQDYSLELTTHLWRL